MKADSHTYDFMRKAVRKITLTTSEEIANNLVENQGMKIYYPSKSIDLGITEPFFILLDD